MSPGSHQTRKSAASSRLGKPLLYDNITLVHYTFFSSPEHEVLMVSYCGQWLSVVRRRATSVVRRPSTFDVYTLETTFVIQFC